jgi:hypothetical protein
MIIEREFEEKRAHLLREREDDSNREDPHVHTNGREDGSCEVARDRRESCD